MPIQCYEYEDQHGECPQRGASIAEQRQWDADHRHNADGHPDVDEQVHEYARGHTVAVYSGERLPAFLRVHDDSGNQEHVQRDHDKTAEESPFLPYGTEDEIGALLRHESEGGLGPAQKAFAVESAGTDGDHALVDIVADTCRILFHPQQHLDSLALMILKDVVEYELGREHERHSCDQPQGGH